MGIAESVKKFFLKRSRAGYTISDDASASIFGAGSKATSGATITERTAMTISTVLACVRVKAATIASLPCILYQRDGKKTKHATQHPLYHILKNEANEETTASVFTQTQQVHRELWGNRMAYIERKKSGYVSALRILMPENTTVFRNEQKRLTYRTRDVNGQYIELDKDDVLHVPGLGFDGLVGKSTVALMREALGLAVSAEEFGARFFSNGANVGGFLTHPSELSEPAAKRLQKRFDEKSNGTENAHRVIVLEEGLTFTNRTMALKDSQFLEGRAFQRIDICSAFGVPPVMVGVQDTTSSWGTGVEQIMLAFLKFTLSPILTDIEQEMNRKLLTPKEREEFYIKHNVDALQRGDYKTRYEGYKIGKDSGFLSTNDIREKEDMDPIEHGDNYYRPLNMVPEGSQIAPDTTKNKETKGDNNVN